MKMFKTPYARPGRLMLAGLLLSVLAGSAMAALPEAVAPEAGIAAGDYIGIMHQYWKAGLALLTLLAGSYAFLLNPYADSLGADQQASFMDEFTNRV